MEEEIRGNLNCPPGFIGPVAVKTDVQVIADITVAAMSDFVCGANKPKYHLAGVNFGRDLSEPLLVADIRNDVSGDPSPGGKVPPALCRGSRSEERREGKECVSTGKERWYRSQK